MWDKVQETVSYIKGKILADIIEPLEIIPTEIIFGVY